MFNKLFSFLLTVVALFNGFTVSNDADTIRYRDVPYGLLPKRQVLDLNIPKSVQGDANMILYVHGGAWTEGSKDSYAETLDSISKSGYVCASLNYRYCGKPNYATVDDIMDDISSALGIIKKLAGENGVNLKGVMLDGGSAGAHLSMMYAYSRVDEAPIKPVAVVARSPISDFTDMSIYDGTLHNIDPDKWCITMNKWTDYLSCMTGKHITKSNISKKTEVLYDISPIKYIDENSVPTIIAHGTKDTVLPYTGSVALDKKLTECGVDHVFITYEGAWHDLTGCPEADEKMIKAYNEFIEKYVAN